ncbi:MAG: hypothetical protein ACOC6F_02460 [bacterium]
MLKRAALRVPDSVLAAFGVGVSVPLVLYLHLHMKNPAYVVTGLLSLGACITYLVLKHARKLRDVSSLIPPAGSRNVRLLLDLVFFALLAYSIYSFACRAEPYVRPLGYFFSIAGMSGFLAAKVLLFRPTRSAVAGTLVQIIILGLALEWSVCLLYPSLVGMDPWGHREITQQMLEAGHIVGEGYQNLPIMHLGIGSVMLLTDLEYKMATMFSISLVQVLCDSSFIFLLGRLLFNTKLGLLSALFVSLANWHVFFGYWTIPNVLGATFVVIGVYLVLRCHREKWFTPGALVVTTLIMGALILTHAIAALWMSLLLFLFWLFFLVTEKLSNADFSTHALLAIGVAFTCAMFSYWMFGSGHTQTLTMLIGYSFDPEAGLTYGVGQAPLEYTPGAQEMLSQAPFTEFLFNTLGMFLYFALAIPGCLYMASRRFGSPHAFFLALGGLAILSVGYFPMLAGISVIEHRWWYMAQILLAIPLSISVSLLASLTKQGLHKVTMTGLVVAAIGFLAAMGLPTNMDNRSFSKNQLVRYAFTSSEMQAMETVASITEGTIGTDSYYRTAATSLGEGFVFDYRLISISEELLLKDFCTCSCSTVLIRKEVVVHPIGWGKGTIYRLMYDPRIVLEEAGFAKFYASGPVSGFRRSFGQSCIWRNDANCATGR